MTNIPIKNLVADPDCRPFGQVLCAVTVHEVSLKDAYAAVSMNSSKQLSLLLSKESWGTLSGKEQLFVLAHEASHILCNHLGRMSQNVNRTVYNYASDAVINSILAEFYPNHFSVPEGVITLDLLLTRGWIKDGSVDTATVDKVYREMMNHPDMQKLLEFLKNCKSLDIHSDLSNMDPMLRRMLEDIVREGKGYGNNSSNTLKRLGEIYSKYFPFETILRKLLERERYDFARPSRRVKVKGSFIPRRKVPKFKVYAAIDISGSCFNYSEQFLGYIQSLPEFEEVVYFDTQIKHIVKKGEAKPATLQGYGGTDVEPVMDRWRTIEQKNAASTQLNFLLLTDGLFARIKEAPRSGNVIVFTTSEEVESPTGRKWLNVHI
jgi:predicted metal-dependent peptidase